MSDIWDGETQNRAQRKVPRFKIQQDFPVSISILQQNQKTFSAVSISPHGLGFKTKLEDSEIAKLKNIDLKIKMDRYSFEVKANVQFCASIQNSKDTYQYVGLKFVGVKPMLNNFLNRIISDRFKSGQLTLS